MTQAERTGVCGGNRYRGEPMVSLARAVRRLAQSLLAYLAHWLAA